MRCSLVLIALAGAALRLGAQPTALSRTQAVATALARAPRLGVAGADTSVALGNLLSARAYPNPTLSAVYTKSTPQYHVSADLPFDYLWLRGLRVASAERGRDAARFRYEFERASVALDADTTYTHALAARGLAALSTRTAVAADSLRRIAVARRDAGDASDLDVELATVNAGQQANVAAGDSLTLVSTLLDLQVTLGLPGDRVTVTPTDSLVGAPRDSSFGMNATTLPVAASAQAVQSAEIVSRLARRSIWGSAGLTFGFEAHDPTGSEPGILPTIGIAIPIPFFDRNRGGIALADAELARARAQYDLAVIETRARAEQAARERANALARVARDERLVASADRVATMSLTAYREGAQSLANVLEAQRNAREALGRYIDDVAAANDAAGVVRLVTTSAGES